MSSSRQIVLDTMCGKPVCRVPFFPSMLIAASRAMGVNFRDWTTNATVLADALARNREFFGFDGIYISSDNCIMAEALGAEVLFPDDDEPMMQFGTLVRDYCDLARLRLPDPQRDGRMPMMAEASRRLVEMLGGEFYLEANIDSGPFALACIIRGTQPMMMDLMDGSHDAERLLEFCAEVTIAYGIAIGKTGVDSVQFGESVASLVNPQMYEQYVFPWDQYVLKRLKENGVVTFLHVCGAASHLLDLLISSGADAVEVDSVVDIAEAVAMGKAHGVTIRGNVDPIRLANAEADEAYRITAECVEAGKASSSHFILCGGCGIPKHTPIENMQAFVRAANDHGAYANQNYRNS